MKKTNLLIVIGLSLVIGGSALNITANFNNDEIKIVKPKRANENLQYFELTLTRTNYVTANDDTTTQFKIRTDKREYQGQNQAMMVKGESITQTQYDDNLNDGNTQNLILYNSTNQYTNILNKWQITPYKYLTETTTETRLTLATMLDYSALITPNGQETANIKLKISTYESLNDWSRYMNQANYYVGGNNRKIIDEIENPQNEQIYNKTTEIIDIEINNTEEAQYISFETELTIINNNNNTNYIFMLIEPYIENLNYGNYIKLINNTPWGYPGSWQPPIFKGYMIPPIENYEIIDLPGLLFNILTMPFAFISTAFNVTLFPGTPYQINLSNLFLTIIAILIFVFIVKLFINMKG